VILESNALALEMESNALALEMESNALALVLGVQRISFGNGVHRIGKFWLQGEHTGSPLHDLNVYCTRA
jgi:hypothetical protein